MSKEKGKGKALFGKEPLPEAGERNAQADALLEELAQRLMEARARDVAESRFRKLHPELHFQIRTTFSSYCNALAMLLKDELGHPLTASQVLDDLKARYGTGQPITLEGLLLEEPRLAQAIVREYGTLTAALEELGLAPDVAAADRRWERERVFHSVLELLGDSVGDLSQTLLSEQVPLLAEVIQLEFGTFSTFHKEFSLWVEAQAAVFVMWGRMSLSRILTRNVPVTSRAAKGGNLADIQRVKLCFAARPGYRLYLLSSHGLLYPVDSAAVPFVSFGAGESEASARLPSLNRGEKPVALLSLSDRESFLALASKLGRVKLVAASSIKRVRAQGTLVMKLAPGDQVVAGSVVPGDYERLLVVSRNGRGVAYDRASMKVSSRTSMGVFRMRFDDERGGEVVGLLGARPGEDLVLLGKSGVLLRLAPEEVPSRKGVSLGRRLWRTPVVDATVCGESTRLLIATKRGRLLCFWDAQVPHRQALRRGVMGIRLDADDSPEAIDTL